MEPKDERLISSQREEMGSGGEAAAGGESTT